MEQRQRASGCIRSGCIRVDTAIYKLCQTLTHLFRDRVLVVRVPVPLEDADLGKRSRVLHLPPFVHG